MALAELIASDQQAGFEMIEVVYVDESAIVRINQEHLERDYVTDIITFRYDEDPAHRHVEGTLFCCASRIKEQAGEFNSSEKREFRRILVHGLLHLLDYEDQTDDEREQMRKLENRYLDLFDEQHAK